MREGHSWRNPKLSRRAFLGATVGASLVPLAPRLVAADEAVVMTVNGAVSPSDLGRTLVHEHVVVDFAGAALDSPERTDADQVFQTALPHLRRLRDRGVTTLVECTPRYIGRRPVLLQRLAKASGVRIVTNTGWYAAVDHKFLPAEAARLGVDEIASRWISEWRDGIEGTGIRPGFLKLGTGNGPLPPLDARLLTAAARVHRETGLTIFVHTGDGEAARDEVRYLQAAGVAPEALVWVHAQNDPGPIQIELARLGVWISLDGYSAAPVNTLRYPNLVVALRDAGLLNRVLLSHDDGWAVDGAQPTGNPITPFANGNPAPYESLFTRLLPDLKARGLSEAEVDQLLVINPREALTVRPRLLA
ncbi:MAG: phosphotriesterase [Verrucomicrobiae bacterium]|nr:phosphotriesterase [Verrucomicrobiae bacterium]